MKDNGDPFYYDEDEWNIPESCETCHKWFCADDDCYEEYLKTHDTCVLDGFSQTICLEQLPADMKCPACQRHLHDSVFTCLECSKTICYQCTGQDSYETYNYAQGPFCKNRADKNPGETYYVYTWDAEYEVERFYGVV